jgi:hypothetical protein
MRAMNPPVSSKNQAAPNEGIDTTCKNDNNIFEEI